MAELNSILLAEDNPKDVELTLTALAENHLANEVVVARDGEEALDYLLRRGRFALRTEGNPAVVLLDLKMPRLDGLEVLRRIKSDDTLKTVPVVMLTSSREERDLVDSDRDAELVREVLLAESLDCEIVRVETREQYIAALETGQFDLIVCDYTLPSFEGGEALEIAAEQWSHIPFLFFSGTIGEEKAVETLKSGAAEYVLKDNLARLPSAVLRALSEARERAERRKAEEALRASEQRTRALMENAMEAILAGGAPGGQETIAMTADGRAVPIEISGSLVEIGGERLMLAIVRNVSERKQLEEQFRQAQKMEAVGRLAGGVAHDFNNLLTVILGYSDVVNNQLPSEHPLRPEVEQIRKAGERAAALTQQLLAFSRTQILLPQVIDVREVVTDIHAMLRRVIGEDID